MNRTIVRIIDTYILDTTFECYFKLYVYVSRFMFRRPQPAVRLKMPNLERQSRTISTNDRNAHGPTKRSAMRNGFQLQLRTQYATIWCLKMLLLNVRISHIQFPFASNCLMVHGPTLTLKLQSDVR